MANRTIKITTSIKGPVSRYWVKIDNREVANRGKKSGQITLDTGSHRLIFWAEGTPGGVLNIEITGVGSAKIDGKSTLKKTPKIPSDGDVADAPRITVS